MQRFLESVQVNCKDYFVMDHAEVVPETDLTRPEGDCYYLPDEKIQQYHQVTYCV